mgnify:CR=1 FL=1
MNINKKIAEELNIKVWQVEAVVQLIDEGCTIPFIARYRKEQHGTLDDEQLRKLDERLTYLRNLEERKETVLASIEEQGKLTEELKAQILAAETQVLLEDLYRPYRPKRRTRATIAKEKGLEGLANLILLQMTETPLEEEAEAYVDEEKGVASTAEAIQGAMDILAETIADEADYRIAIRKTTMQKGILFSTAKDPEEKSVYENYYDFLEKENLLLPTVGISPVAQESFAFNSELPSENVTKTTQCWGFLEAQEATAISTDMFGEFVFPYQDRLAKRFGLLSYGCCERVDAIWPEYVSKWKHLRKLSVSPFNNERQVGEFLRGSNVVYYSKPRAEYVTNPGPLDEDAIREYFKGVAQAASGCLLEVAQREVGTIYGDFNRGKRYVELAKESIEKYWKP